MNALKKLELITANVTPHYYQDYLLFGRVLTISIDFKDSTCQEGVPSFKLLQGQSNSTDPSKNIPQYTIVFPNGHNTTTKLTYYNPFSKSSKIDLSNACNYLGFLNDEPGESVISITGCSHLKLELRNKTTKNKDDGTVYITMLSKKSRMKTFFIFQYGKTKEVLSGGLDDQTMFAEQTVLNRFKYNKHKIRGTRRGKNYNEEEKTIPPRRVIMRVEFGYDKSIKEAMKTHDLAENFIASLMVHMQTFYLHPSLKTKIIFQVSVRALL